jgi:GT2 family glycosyltransferase
MSLPDVSIVIVSWNTRDLLSDCLQSLRGQAGVSTEVFVVDNDSQDGSASMVAAEFPGVRLIQNQENRGFARASNQGLTFAHGRYRMLLNSDTRVPEGALRRLVAYLDAHPRVGACGPQLRHFDGTLQPTGRAFPTLLASMVAITPVPGWVRRATADRFERRDYGLTCDVDELCGAALILRAEALAQVGLLDEDFFFFGEDVDLCWRLHDAGWRVVYLPEAVIEHGWGGSWRKTRERTSLMIQRAYVLLMRKHRPGFSAAAVTGLSLVLTLLKAVRRAIPAWIRGGSRAAMASLRLHRDELTWLLAR